MSRMPILKPVSKKIQAKTQSSTWTEGGPCAGRLHAGPPGSFCLAHYGGAGREVHVASKAENKIWLADTSPFITHPMPEHLQIAEEQKAHLQDR